MPHSILVTGATGTVGRAIVTQLAERGADVRAGVRDPDAARALLPETVDRVLLDLDRPETFDAALAGVDRLFLLVPRLEHPLAAVEALLDAAGRAGVRHVVKLSVLGAEVEPGQRVGRFHRSIEARIERSGLAWTFLRPTAFLQNFVHDWGDGIRDRGAIQLPLGEGEVAWLDARDLAAVAVEVLLGEGHEGRAYEITGSRAHDVAAIARAIGEATGRQVVYVDVPEEHTREAMVDAGAPEWMVDATMELHEVNREGHGAGVTSVVKQLTGREPVDLDAFVREHAEHWKG